MCILFIAIEQHPLYPLIIAANRDEFYARPTQESAFWPESPELLAGRDLQSGGTWMGVNKSGYIAALTNVRDLTRNDQDAISRGHLVSNFLQQPQTDYEHELQQSADHYNGYNLLYGHWRNLSVYNNINDTLQRLSAGVYGLSNAMLDTPWPKLSSGVQNLTHLLASDPEQLPEQLFTVLADSNRAADEHLPDTGIGLAYERALSSIFINLDNYGTRSSTVVLISDDQQLQWYERSYDDRGTIFDTQHYELTLQD
ncbi:MAG: NRDE family protein [Gammaproteobacteria bacterium]